jgi:hypothetical protein
LWQAWSWWDEILTMRNRHITRIKHAKAGRSNLVFLADAQAAMFAAGKEVGPIWDWLVGIKGIGEHLAAKLLAQIDDIGCFATISKLRRFAGLAVLDGKAEPKSSEHYNRRLKATLIGELGVAAQFITHYTFPYRDLYDEKRADDRRKHPDVICKECGLKWEDCPNKKKGNMRYNDAHMLMRAKRKVAQVFLSHLWVTWREMEGLPVSKPYVEAILGHTNIIEPPQP